MGDQSQQSTKDFMDDFEPVDNCLNSIIGQTVELTDEFKANYEKWLQREVYNTEIKWELLLSKEDRESLEKEIADYPLIEDFDQSAGTAGTNIATEASSRVNANESVA